jgi:hypothetical protein
VYKVLLDLLVIKTVTSFTAQPLRWFTILSLPALLFALTALTHTAYTLVTSQTMSLPIAGSGLIFFASAIVSLCSGALGELVYKLGDVHAHDFSRLTQQSGQSPAVLKDLPNG